MADIEYIREEIRLLTAAIQQLNESAHKIAKAMARHEREALDDIEKNSE